MEDEILNKNFDDDSETENYSLNESSDVSTDEECDSILTNVQMSSSNCFIGKNGYRWNKNHAIIGRTRSHNIITHLPGLKGPAKPKPNCGIDIFNLFFTAAIIKQISEFTNAKIEEFRQRISDLTKSTYSNFTSEIEIRAFLGLLYLAGVYKSGHENVESLFASDGTGRDIFRSVMSVKRFLFLLLCIRFDNFKTRCKEDRLSPIRDIFQTIIEKFQSCYTPAEYLTVDEMLVGFRGKCPFKIYIPSKPNKYGIKIVILADSRTHYMYNAMVYIGKSKTPKSKELSLPTQIVLDISRPLWKSNRNITADNWFTSIELVDKLKEHGLTYLGTMRKNKPQIPPQFQPHPKRESGTSIFGFSGTKTLVSYVPKKRKSVILISSMHHDNKCDETTGKPDIIMDYNLTKGGVDTIDQMVSNFSTSRRSRRWPLALFYALLDITALNSYIIFNYQIDKKDQKERSNFIVDLGRSLIDEHLATHQQRETRLSIYKDLIETANNDSDFLKTIVTGDETWYFLFYPQTKKQSLEWHTPSSPRKKKVRLDKSKGKVMLVVFFDYQGLVYYEFIKEGVSINKQAYKEILVRLRDAIRRKRNQLFESKQWKLLHDNAPAHRAIIVQDYLAKHSVSVLPHPPYSPYIAPCDFFFPKLKMTLKGRRFSS
ncbi:hypothetical protein LAZ67_2001179 [Cordylochernes scorpioides]|uniref:PiggyBac transposable element-derived protein domain-containing protein n=1 Tax=Cordylochernes scorpioides TaxID=51811 RepID=A0ABY6K2P8_9ARAC|nr:hypothetical protein LAZ67_2001179 [Cordylochernes scorpioides]